MKLPKAPARTTPNFALSTLGRAISEGLSRREFTRKEMHRIVEFFSNGQLECVYCGSPDIKRWDHLIAISNGGETVMGNIVPACQVCDDSKQDEDFERWMISKADRSPRSRGVPDIDKRIQRIRQYIKYFGYNHQSIEERLDATEQAKLGELRSKTKALQKEIESFISEFRKRKGLR